MALHKWLLVAGIPLFLMGNTAKAQVVTGPPTNLTAGSFTKDYMGKISANGQKIVFTRELGHFNGRASVYDIYTMNVDGSNKTWVRFPQDNSQEEWASISPDGTKVAFHSWATGGIDIYAVDLVTGKSVRMTTNAKSDTWPNWSPDGKKLVFQSVRNGDATHDQQVYIMNAVDADGNLTPENTTDNVPIQLTNFDGTSAAKGMATRPSFSADGKQVLFAGRDSSSAAFNIFRCDITDADGDKFGDNLTKIVDIPTVKPGYFGVSNPEPTQATPGGPIFFIDAFAPDSVWGRYHVYRVNPDGTGLWQVTGSDAYEDDPYAGAGKLLVNLNTPDIGVGNKDVGIYTLTDATGDGTLSGTLQVSASADVSPEGYTIEAYNGTTLVGSATTDATGHWSMTLPAGGYTLYITYPDTQTVPITKIYRGTVVPPNGNVVFDMFTTPANAPRVLGVIPTIEDGKVSVVWQPAGLPVGITYTGFNVYRGASENGPWTKLNEAPITPAQTYEYVDAAPGDLASAFYTVTAVTTDGTTTIESMYADAGQAANNLVYNPSFEQVDSSNNPLGWQLVLGAGDATASTDTTGLMGSRAAYIQAGATKGDAYLHMAQPYFVPVAPSQAYVEGMFAKIQSAATTKPVNMKAAYTVTEYGGAFKYYPAAYETNALAASATVPNKDWTWLYNVGQIDNYEFAPQARLSPFWSPDTGSTTSRAYFDEVRYQVKRVGETGIVWGRIVDANNNGVGGVKVTNGTVYSYSGPTGQFILRNVPTGDATITLSYPGQTDITKTASNIGGYVFPTDLKYSGVVPPALGAKVLLPNGQPAVGAHVRVVVGNAAIGDNETAYEADVDSDGLARFDFDGSLPASGTSVWMVATLSGYQSAYAKNVALGAAGTSYQTLTLPAAVPVLQIAQTTTPPTIDGVVNASEWSKSQAIPVAFQYPTANAPTQPSTAYALWDANNLYLAIVATEPATAGMKALASGPDALTPSIFADDRTEIFLDPTVSAAIGTNRNVWQIAANTNQSAIGTYDGTLLTGPQAQSGTDGSFNNITDMNSGAGLTAASSVDATNGKWSVEMKIPFAGLTIPYSMDVPVPTVGTEWRGLISRYRSQGDEYSSTSLMSGGFAKAELWNTLKFVANVVVAVKGDLNGDGQVTAEDAAIAARIGSGAEALGSRLSQGDVAGNDGKVDQLDATRILRKVNGLEPNFPQ